ncbi:TNT domain-containing protein [Mycobacterium simiae]
METDHFPSGLGLDRLGPNGGGYLSPEGTPLAERATPPGLAAQYHVFQGTGNPVPPDKNWLVLHGRAKSAFGQPGGGEQWVVIDRATGEPVSVAELKRSEMIIELLRSD